MAPFLDGPKIGQTTENVVVFLDIGPKYMRLVIKLSAWTEVAKDFLHQIMFGGSKMINGKYIAYQKNGLWGLISTLGKNLIAPKYQSIIGMNGTVVQKLMTENKKKLLLKNFKSTWIF